MLIQYFVYIYVENFNYKILFVRLGDFRLAEYTYNKYKENQRWDYIKKIL